MNASQCQSVTTVGDPASDQGFVDAQFTGDLGDDAAGIDHPVGGLDLVLGRKRPRKSYSPTNRRSRRKAHRRRVRGANPILISGTDHLIDLRPTNVDKFNVALQPFVKVAEKVGKAHRGTKGDATEKVTGSGRSKEQLQAVRDWAVKNGYDVAPRGRVKVEILDAFDTAH